jgi:hypothetical protein
MYTIFKNNNPFLKTILNISSKKSFNLKIISVIFLVTENYSNIDKNGFIIVVI